MISSLDGKPKLLPAIHPNCGLEYQFCTCLENALRQMHDSLMQAITGQYIQTPPKMARDTPASDLIQQMRTLGRVWTRHFDEAAQKMAKWFATSAFERSDFALKQILKDAGWTVAFKETPVVKDVLHATIGEQVGLIKSIAQEHLQEVEGLVLRSVQKGGDLGTLTHELGERYGVTKKRAEFLARHQNAQSTANITRVRQLELGIGQAVWVHSRAGREPRASHVAFSGKTYDVAKGALIDGEYIFPGQLWNCRCVAKSVIPGRD